MEQAEEYLQLEKTSGYFKWMLDEYTGNAYVADVENYELLYLNKTSRETLQLPEEKLIGRKCYEMIQNRNSPCPFCNNATLKEDTFFEWEFYNPFLKRAYMLKDRIIYWNGRKARLELSIDNLSPEYKLEKMDREREAIMRTIPGGFARVDARDGRTVLWYGGDFLHMIGYTKEQFKNELNSECSYIHPDDMIRATKIMNHSKETGKPTAAEGRIITRDGKQKILTMTFSYVSSDNSWDGIESFYSVGIDVLLVQPTEQRRGILQVQAVPPDMRHLFSGLNPPDRPMDKSKAFTIPYLISTVEEQLHPQTDAQNRLFLRLRCQHLIQARAPQAFRRVRESAYAGQDDGLRPLQLCRIAGDTGGQSQIAHGVGNAHQIAHSVIHNCCKAIHPHSTPLVETTPSPSTFTACLSATPRDLNRASVMWWALFP